MKGFRKDLIKSLAFLQQISCYCKVTETGVNESLVEEVPPVFLTLDKKLLTECCQKRE